MEIDLTPFGFTPTESLVYGALVDRGASSGYQLGKFLRLARANAYQALHGLVAKGAAVVVEEGPPQLIRAVSPTAVLAMVSQDVAERLERLERQVHTQTPKGADAVIAVRGRRGLEQVAMQIAVRPSGPVTALAPVNVLAMLAPIWRKRAADGSPTNIWAIGDADLALPHPITIGRIPVAAVEARFGAPIALLTTPESALVAMISAATVEGYWSSDPVIRGLAVAAIADLATSARHP